jgi:hypothetical protein
MTGEANVRAARWHLATALAAEGSNATEVRQQLLLALTEVGQDPADWEIHNELGRLASAAGDWTVALRNILTAVLVAPASAIDALAESALIVLDKIDATAVMDSLRDFDLDPLRRLAGTDEASGLLVRLTTQLLLFLGDSQGAYALHAAKPPAGPVGSDKERIVNGVASVIRMIEDDRWDDAMQALERDSDQAAYSASADIRVLLLYASGRAEDAWSLLENSDRSTSSFEQGAVRVLILLQRAAAAGIGTERRELIDHALAAASAAAQIEPTSPEASLLRAQATLEGGLDLDEGRRLLGGAFRRLSQGTSHINWWRAQERVRKDEVYQYFRIEVAAIQHKDDEVISRAASVTGSLTEYVQDAAIAELEARIREERGERELAAAAYGRAATLFRTASLRSRAIPSFENAVRLGSPVATTLDLVELLYQASFPVDLGGDGDTSAAGNALRYLAAIDTTAAGSDALRTCFLTGMMLVRQSAEKPPDKMARWRPLPLLLAAALGMEENPVPAAHLAWALRAVSLWRPALRFGERALASRSSADPWIAETAIVMRFSWNGLLDEQIQELLPEIESDAWVQAVVAYGHLLADDRTQVAKLVDGITLEHSWARQLQAHATARCRSFEESVPLFRKALEDSLVQGDTETAVGTAIILGDLRTGLEQLDKNGAGSLSEYQVSYWRAVVDVLRSSDGSAERAADLVDRAVRPYDLRSFANVDLPTLIDANAAKPTVSRVLSAMRERCLSRVDRLAGEPSLAVELDAEHVRCPDPALQAAVHTLLDVAQQVVTGTGAAAAAAARRLAYRPNQSKSSFELTIGMIAEQLDKSARKNGT